MSGGHMAVGYELNANHAGELQLDRLTWVALAPPPDPSLHPLYATHEALLPLGLGMPPVRIYRTNVGGYLLDREDGERLEKKMAALEN